MTVDECRAAVDKPVLYRAPHQHSGGERGVITSVNSHYAYVRYGADSWSKATSPQYLTLAEHP